MWFKNLVIYKLGREVDLSSLEKYASEFKFTPCGSQDIRKFGWCTALGKYGDLYTHESNGQVMIKAQRQEKLIPTPVIKERVDEKVTALEAEQGRKLKKTEKDTIKDEVMMDLLPRAFSKNSFTTLVILPKDNLIIVDSGSFNKAEDAIALLRKTLSGGLPVTPLAFETPIEVTLTDWVKTQNHPACFSLMNEAELKSPLEHGGTIRCKEQDLSSEEISLHISEGKLVTKLALDWNNQVSFTLCDDGTIKKIKFDDEIKDQNDDISREDVAARLDSDYSLMFSVLGSLLHDVEASMAGKGRSSDS